MSMSSREMEDVTDIDIARDDALENGQGHEQEQEQGQERKMIWNKELFYVILCGQVLSIFITGTGTFSELLSEYGVNIPTAQSFANYIVLSLFMIPLIQQRQNRNWKQLSTSSPKSSQSSSLSSSSSSLSLSPSSTSLGEPNDSFLLVAWWKYAILAFFDVEGNYLLVRAYQYTTITSVQLLDCFTVPLVMLLSYFALKRRYILEHILGCLVCIVGLILLVVSDVINGRNDMEDSPTAGDQFIGDILVLLGCVCYACSNLGQEVAVQKYDRIEYLAMIGCFGSVISAIQMLIFELDAIMAVDWTNGTIWAYMIGFSCCLFLMYIGVPLFLQRSNATVLNLSFLTSDFWSILVATQLFHASLHMLYFVAFTLIIAGLICYNLANSQVRLKQVFNSWFGRRRNVETATEAHHPLSDDDSSPLVN